MNSSVRGIGSYQKKLFTFNLRLGAESVVGAKACLLPHGNDYFVGKKNWDMLAVFQSKAGHTGHTAHSTPATKVGHLLAEQINYSIFICGHKQ